MGFRVLYSILLLTIFTEYCLAKIDTNEQEETLRKFVEQALNEFKVVYDGRSSSLNAHEKEDLRKFNQKLKQQIPSINKEIITTFIPSEHQEKMTSVLTDFENTFEDLLKIIEEGNSKELNELKNDYLNKTMDSLGTGLGAYFIMANESADLNNIFPSCIDTSQHSILQLYYTEVALPYEIKNAIITRFLLGLNKSPSNYSEDDNILVAGTLERIRLVQSWLEKSFPVSSRHYANCSTAIDDTLMKFSPFLQKYLGSRFVRDSDEEVKQYVENQADNGWDSAFCLKYKEFKRCTGTIKACDNFSAPNKYSFSFCPSPLSSERFYDSITLKKSSVTYPTGGSSSCNNSYASWVKLSTPTCVFSWCICEDDASDIDRYFSLKNVTADVNSNKVVTGLRLKKENYTIHLQIQQGTLTQGGKIDQSTVEWKALEELNPLLDEYVMEQDYHKVTFNGSKIFLNNLDAKEHKDLPNHVITGVRFKAVPYKNQSDIVLDIQVTPYNTTTFKLRAEHSVWLSHSDTKFLDENSHLKMLITVSSLEYDASQSVFPVFDGRDVAPRPAVPLSGVGLFLKGSYIGDKKLAFVSSQMDRYPVTLNVFTHEF